ncbi:maleylacetoacetate isomerase [Parasalinivibrio latis]|uniref:maleylacetoacetate isomerase n=1 Tax=Parasalinivibrio latis TaxID=2952610 RepID=UPI0030E2A554
MQLYDYSRSTAAFRVRIALNLKEIPYDSVPVSLIDGEQNQEGYRNINAAGLVPALEDGGQTLTQSLAILEYLDEIHPHHPLLPKNPLAKARCRALAMDVACDMHPLNNLRVLKHLTGELGHSEDEKLAWYHHWLKQGFGGLEAKLGGIKTPYCSGDTPMMADVCLIPQLFNARRFNFALDAYPTLVHIEQNCMALPAFANAHPDAPLAVN